MSKTPMTDVGAIADKLSELTLKLREYSKHHKCQPVENLLGGLSNVTAPDPEKLRHHLRVIAEVPKLQSDIVVLAREIVDGLRGDYWDDIDPPDNSEGLSYWVPKEEDVVQMIGDIREREMNEVIREREMKDVSGESSSSEESEEECSTDEEQDMVDFKEEREIEKLTYEDMFDEQVGIFDDVVSEVEDWTESKVVETELKKYKKEIETLKEKVEENVLVAQWAWGRVDEIIDLVRDIKHRKPKEAVKLEELIRITEIQRAVAIHVAKDQSNWDLLDKIREMTVPRTLADDWSWRDRDWYECETLEDTIENIHKQTQKLSKYRIALQHVCPGIAPKGKDFGLVKKWYKDKKALDEIREEQMRTDLIFGEKQFELLVREIGVETTVIDGLRWDPDAIRALQTASEDYLTSLMEDVNLCGVHDHRTHIRNSDVQLARRLRGERR
jgi:histone H3